VAAALVGVSLPAHFFSTIPHGTVSAQVSAVAWKLVATYVLVIGGWVLLLAWAAVLLDRIASDAEEDGDALGEPVIVGSGPLGEDAVRLPPPEEGESV
jgi:hypothetical protein